MLLIGNKVDLQEEREVTYDDAAKFGKNWILKSFIIDNREIREFKVYRNFSQGRYQHTVSI